MPPRLQGQPPRALAAVAAFAIGLSWSSPDIVLRHDRDLERSLELGDRFTFVCAVAGGSGTLIHPEWILTAAHVIEAMQPGEGVDCDGQRREIAGTLVSTALLADGSGDPIDLGLVRLDAPIASINPAALYEGEDEQELTSRAGGRPAIIVGTGYFGTAVDPDLAAPDGRRRAVTNRIVDQDIDWLRVVLNRPPGGTDLEGIQASGDSGGPLLVHAGDGWVVAGVGSFSDYIDAEPGTGQYGAMDFYARVAPQRAWISSTIANQADGS